MVTFSKKKIGQGAAYIRREFSQGYLRRPEKACESSQGVIDLMQ
jgi:hypothetical protein